MKINFAKYLLEILLEQGKVDVPGLGEFVMERKPASFGDGRQSLKGPQQEIIFNESHDSNDTRLQDRIASKEESEVDSVKAKEFVNQFTSDVLKGLMANKEVEIAYVGTIKRDSDEHLSFTQNQATIDKLNRYLPEVDLPKPQKLEPVEKEPLVKVAPVANPVAEEKPILSTDKPSSIRTDIKTETPPADVEPEKSSFGWIKWVLGILGLVLLSTLLLKMCGKEDTTAYKTTQTEELVQDDNNQDETAEEIDGQSTDENSQDNPVENSDNTTDDDGSSVESGNKSDDYGSANTESKTASDFNKEQCIVIIGSYQSGKNVRNASSQIESKGYIIYTESHGAYTRVGVKINCDDISGSYSSFLQKLSREFSVNAWFLSPEVQQ